MKIHKEEANMDKPRICEVLGVEVGERFEVEGYDSVNFYINANGDVCSDYTNDPDYCTAIYQAINHPDRIIRKPRFTEQEVEDAKTIVRIHADATHLERDSTGGNVLRLCFFERNSRPINIHMFPSIKPGESYTLKEIIGGAE